MRRKVDVTVGPDTCPLCGRRALADFGDEGIVCGGCDSAFELDRATGRRRYLRVSAAYRPLESRLSGSWLSQAEVVEVGRSLTLGRARWLVMLSAGAIATIALFTCALGGAFALAPGIRDSQARIALANASMTTTLTLTPTTAAPGTATFGPAPTAMELVGTPARSPSPTARGPLNSPLPTPSRASDLPNPTATRAQAPTGTPIRPAAAPTQSPTEALPTVVLPPTFTPVAAVPLPAATSTPPIEAITATATVTVVVGVVTVTPTVEASSQSTNTPTPTPSPTPTPAGTPSTATPSASPTSSIPRSGQYGVVVILAVNYQGTDIVNEADEYIDVQNKGGSNVQLQGWAIQRLSNGAYVSMPALTLLAGQTCRIYSANPQPFADCGANAFGRTYLWNNTADTLLLLDSSLRLVSEYSYPQ